MIKKVLLYGGGAFLVFMFIQYNKRLIREQSFVDYLKTFFSLFTDLSKNSSYPNVDYVNLAIYLKKQGVL